MDPDWVDAFPIENGDFPASYVSETQRVQPTESLDEVQGISMVYPH